MAALTQQLAWLPAPSIPWVLAQARYLLCPGPRRQQESLRSWLGPHWRPHHLLYPEATQPLGLVGKQSGPTHWVTPLCLSFSSFLSGQTELWGQETPALPVPYNCQLLRTCPEPTSHSGQARHLGCCQRSLCSWLAGLTQGREALALLAVSPSNAQDQRESPRPPPRAADSTQGAFGMVVPEVSGLG